MGDKTRWCPSTIILGPGGVKGFATMGSLLYLEKIGWLENVSSFVGVSVGAIIAVLLTAGYTVGEIVEHSLSVSLFHDFMSLDISQIKENSGLISNHQVKDRLEERLVSKFGYLPTLKEFYNFTGITYTAVTLNIDKGEVEYISHLTEPDLPVVDAVMLSMNIPFVFYKIRYKGCTYVDGALGNPYPMDYFDDGKTNILGIYIEHDEHSNSDSIASYFYFILHSMTGRLKKLAMQKLSPHCKHLIIVTKTTDTIGLAVSTETKSELVAQGYEQASAFIGELREDEARGT